MSADLRQSEHHVCSRLALPISTATIGQCLRPRFQFSTGASYVQTRPMMWSTFGSGGFSDWIDISTGFLNSVDRLHMTLPFNRQRLTDVLMECVRRSGLDDAYVEMICTRGVSPTFSRDPRDAENTFIAFAIPFGWVANEEQRARGLNISISDIPRIPPQSVDPTVKNYHWLDFIAGLYGAYENDAENVILVDLNGNISEGPGFNSLRRQRRAGHNTRKRRAGRDYLDDCARIVRGTQRRSESWRGER